MVALGVSDEQGMEVGDEGRKLGREPDGWWRYYENRAPLRRAEWKGDLVAFPTGLSG